MEDFSLPPKELERPVFKSNEPRKKRNFLLVGLVGFLGAVYFFFFSAPLDFPAGNIVEVLSGASLRGISLDFKTTNVIRSRFLFEVFSILYGGERHIISGDYFFEKRIPVFEVARRVSKGDRQLVAIKVTIPEGFDRTQMAQLFDSKLISFSQEVFLLATEGREGYLFPDTYFFFNTESVNEIISVMRDNFEKKIEPLLPEITASGKTEREIIIMASLVEREAKGDADRGVISGILWKRIAMGMALQVDAAPVTYKERGLPEAPIASPGLSSILAAIHPEKSPYLYYLHDEDGNIHYARNFEEHKANKLKYLK